MCLVTNFLPLKNEDSGYKQSSKHLIYNLMLLLTVQDGTTRRTELITSKICNHIQWQCL